MDFMPNKDKLKKKLVETYTRELRPEYCGFESDLPPACNHIVDTWAANKQELLNLLSKHPKFDKDMLYIIDEVVVPNNPDFDVVGRALRELRDACSSHVYANKLILLYDEEYYFKVNPYMVSGCFDAKRVLADNLANYGAYCRMALNEIVDLISGFYRDIGRTQGEVAYFSEYSVAVFKAYMSELGKRWGAPIRYMEFKTKPKNKQKITKFLDAWFKEIGLDGVPEYAKCMARLGDALVTNPQKRWVTLSVNPLDYANMSRGASWRSCHRLLGEYRTGHLSYMQDETSMVMSLYSHCDLNTKEWSDKEFKFSDEEKVSRMMMHYNVSGKSLLQSRLYPDYQNDSPRAAHRVDFLREWCCKILAECHEIENSWWLFNQKKVSGGYHLDFIRTRGGTTHYRDYEHGGYYPNIAHHKSSGEEDKPQTILIGHPAPCFSCLNDNDATDDFYHEDCDGSCKTYECYNCEDTIRVGRDSYWVDYNGNYFCSNCFSTCDCCNEHAQTSDMYNVGDDWMCPRCYDKNCNECAECGEAFYTDAMIKSETNEYWYCAVCASKRLARCAVCDDWHDNERMESTPEGDLCPDCYENYVREHKEEEEDEQKPSRNKKQS